ncbi:uncharacterized protein LOC130691556 [Daphnia carinata]|uniref:uncharacterized protein LOC130691556 n=1 Tax=Daphnia carinata TaxID=120202 RepID=UPI00257B58FB|nr:uncharacterized protein LOC130691556 [Daphnia carinata]
MRLVLAFTLVCMTAVDAGFVQSYRQGANFAYAFNTQLHQPVPLMHYPGPAFQPIYFANPNGLLDYYENPSYTQPELFDDDEVFRTAEPNESKWFHSNPVNTAHATAGASEFPVISASASGTKRPNRIAASGANRPNGIAASGASRPHGIAASGASRPHGIAASGANRPNGIAASAIGTSSSSNGVSASAINTINGVTVSDSAPSAIFQYPLLRLFHRLFNRPLTSRPNRPHSSTSGVRPIFGDRDTVVINAIR